MSLSVVASDGSCFNVSSHGASEGSISIPPDWFPFDGTCEGSKGADLSLVFSDGSVLHAHSHLLAMLSPVLKTAVEECAYQNTLAVESDSRDAWILLLNILHPVKSLTVGRDLDVSCLPLLSCIAGLVQKYDVAHVHEFLDDVVSEFIAKKKNEIANSRANEINYSYSSHHKKLALADDDVVCNYLVFAAKFKMGKTLASCTDYLTRVIVTMSRFSCRTGRNENETGPVLSRLIQRLAAEGFPQEGCRLASEIMTLFEQF